MEPEAPNPSATATPPPPVASPQPAAVRRAGAKKQPAQVKKQAAGAQATMLAQDSYESLGELPKTYQSGSIFLAARDPHWLFIYWDVDLESFETTQLLDGERAFYLKAYKENGELVDQIAVHNEARNWYFPIKETGIGYYVELGFNDLDCKWAVIGRSNTIHAPSDAFAEGLAEFASVPFHLSFQRLLEMVQGQMQPEGSLVATLGQMQSGHGSPLQTLAPAWTGEQKQFLGMLVGDDLVAQISLGSTELDQNFRERLSSALAENLSSASSSELSFLHQLTDLESLFTGSEALSGGSSGSWMSGSGSGGMEQIGLSGGASGGMAALAYLSSRGGSPENLAGLFSAYLAGASGAGFSFGGESSGLASGGGASWNWGSESSWSAAGGESSGAGASTSSWGLQPGRTYLETTDHFALQLCAEVVLNGQTQPGASLWIDGKPVAVGADGRFEHRFQTLKEDADIPIVAESADGQEIRMARLSFTQSLLRGEGAPRGAFKV